MTNVLTFIAPVGYYLTMKTYQMTRLLKKHFILLLFIVAPCLAINLSNLNSKGVFYNVYVNEQPLFMQAQIIEHHKNLTDILLGYDFPISRVSSITLWFASPSSHDTYNKRITNITSPAKCSKQILIQNNAKPHYLPNYHLNKHCQAPVIDS